MTKQKQLEDTEEAESEITFVDDDSNCDLVVGECFFETEKLKAEEMLQTKVTSERKSIEDKKEELTRVRSAMQQLKEHLYGKFGSSINLEE
jgi:prefoldin subunit 4|tara:strand:+ start:338 stop:610 length:273 start_codon:yes stop_codon:yes gene_type:complete